MLHWFCLSCHYVLFSQLKLDATVLLYSELLHHLTHWRSYCRCHVHAHLVSCFLLIFAFRLCKVQFKVWMFKCLLSVDSFFRIHPQHFHHQILCFFFHHTKFFLFEIKLRLTIFLDQIVVIFWLEHAFSKRKHVKDKPKTEDVANRLILGFHIFDVDDLRGDKARSTTSGEKVHFSVREFGESKIGNNTIESIFFSEKNVLRFEISVHDFFGVHVFESFK